jgi:peptide chain release factor 2
MANPGFWQDRKAATEASQELVHLKEELESFQKLKKELERLDEKQIEKVDELRSSSRFADARVFEEKLKKEELKFFLSGEHDKNNAILSIYSGAGGQDAQDWTTLLLRMYERYCERKGWKATVLHQSFGEGGGPEGRIGTKSVTLEVKGSYAYGLLKKEGGVHRLVRISPFSAKSLRHTSFASVEVLPEIPQEEGDIKINPDDLKIETFRASGPGGQYVNRRETAVRITHLPTGIKVSCQSERLQGVNKEKALRILAAKLYQIEKEKKDQEIEKIKGKKVSAGWGNQIRSYVLHPYKMVKDLRADMETSAVDEVLDGNLDQFIEKQVFAEQSR